MKAHNKNLRWHTNVHIYGQSLAIGDAHFLIDKIKDGDAATKYFYNVDGERSNLKLLSQCFVSHLTYP